MVLPELADGEGRLAAGDGWSSSSGAARTLSLFWVYHFPNKWSEWPKSSLSSPLCGATDEEQGALPREEESLTSVLRLGSAWGGSSEYRDSSSTNLTCRKIFSRTRIKASPGNTRVRCKMLYEQNNAPWEIIDLGVSLDTKHLHPHEKSPMESCLYDSIRWSSVDDICCCWLQPIST